MEHPDAASLPLTGIAPEDLSHDVWLGVLGIYHETVLGTTIESERARLLYPLDQALEGDGEIRIGSRFSPHSKLVIDEDLDTDVLTFDMQVNSPSGKYEDPTTSKGQEAEKTRAEFRERTVAFLESLGVARSV